MTPPHLRVVVVDDDSDLRRLLRIVLEQDGRFEVAGEAGDGAAAVEAIATLQPDCVVLDLSMPVMDGLQALPLIRNAAPSARVLVLSGFGHKQLGGQALNGGADAYLEKGEAFDDLADRLAGLCAAGLGQYDHGTVDGPPL